MRSGRSDTEPILHSPDVIRLASLEENRGVFRTVREQRVDGQRIVSQIGPRYSAGLPTGSRRGAKNQASNKTQHTHHD
jgi:hypothetical protein